jgi:hypothetical protein
MAPPDFETMIVQRLFACAKDIAGIGRAYQLAPSMPPGIGEFPITWVEIGPMLQPVPRQDGSAGKFMVERNYTVKTAVASLESVTDLDNLGVDALNANLPWFAILRNYYLLHPRLETSTLPPLDYMVRDVHYTDTGNAQITSPGGVPYVGVLSTLTIAMTAAISRIS